jgi:glutamate synthase (NADPH) large chain
LAEGGNEHLAALGFRSLDEAIGHAELLDTTAAVAHWKASGLDLSPLLHVPALPEGTALHRTTVQDHGLDKALDHELIALASAAIENGEPVRAQLPIKNINRTVGTMLSHEVVKRHTGDGLPDGTIDLTFIGSAGNSFGAFVAPGITLRLEGDANDYVGKGLSGGRITIRPHRDAAAVNQNAAKNVIAGNVIGYGATSGRIHLRGTVGERFCVRNSGATAVVEGVGDHALEYMTGGTVVILGEHGRNLAAGMSGGTAYVLDLKIARVNPEMVAVEALDAEDRAILEQLVLDHYEETGSTVAEELLADWAGAVGRFAKIMPVDYKRVLAARAAAQAAGLTEEQTFDKIMEAARG